MIRVAIVYHYIALYRQPIFTELMSRTSVEYTILAGVESEINIKKIDPKYSSIPLAKGGLRWKILNNHWLLRKKFLWQSGLIKQVTSNKFNGYVFLGSSFHLSTWIAAIIARILGKKVFFWMHGVYTDRLRPFDYLKLYVFYPLANGYLLYGNRAAQIMQSRGIDKSKIFLIYNSLDYKENIKLRRPLGQQDFLNFREKYFQDPDSPIVVFIGRINSTKKLDLLLKAQNFLIEQNSLQSFNLIFVGGGDEEGNLINLCKSLGIDSRAKFLGPLYNEYEIAEILMHSDLCVTPGEIGLTAIHSLSYGTPVISHNNFNVQMPEVESIKIGITGDLYKFGDFYDLAKIIEHWLQRHSTKSPDLMQNCYDVLDKHYNPLFQANLLDTIFTAEVEN